MGEPERGSSEWPATRLDRMAKRALSGEGAHATADQVFARVPWRQAGVRPAGAPHSIYELLQHLIFWQEWAFAWLAGGEPALPRHAAESWPDRVAPESRAEWQAAVGRFRRGLAELASSARAADPQVAHGRKTRLEMLLTIGAHNSYHLGQVVLLRQQLGLWPPPGGGLTW